MSSGSSLPCSSECLGSSVETCRETSPWCWWRTKLGRNKAGWSGMLPPMKAWACGSGQCYLSSMWPTGGSLLISITLFPSISRNAEGGPVFPPPTPSTQDTHPECTYTCTYTNVHIHMRAHTFLHAYREYHVSLRDVDANERSPLTSLAWPDWLSPISSRRNKTEELISFPNNN